MTPTQRYLLSDLGSFRPVVLECVPCDDCGCDTDVRELEAGVCWECLAPESDEATHWVRNGSML